MRRKELILALIILLLSCNNQVEQKTFTISYNGNGHTSGNLPNTQYFIQGETGYIFFQKDSLNKTNHVLSEWNTKPDGSGESFALFQSIELANDLQLYAIWEEATNGLLYTIPLSFNPPIGHSTVSDSYPNKTTTSNIIIPEKYNGYIVKQVKLFSHNESITSVMLPDSINRIRDSAFSFCTNLKTINLPKGLEIIDHGTFIRCDSLINIKIPEGVKVIKSLAFFDCTSLTSVDLPETLSVIESSAFGFCKSLKEISIPKNVNRIEERAFSGNPGEGLEKLTIFAVEPPEIQEETLQNNLVSIEVPLNSVSKYKTSKYWSNFESIIKGIEE